MWVKKDDSQAKGDTKDDFVDSVAYDRGLEVELPSDCAGNVANMCADSDSDCHDTLADELFDNDGYVNTLYNNASMLCICKGVSVSTLYKHADTQPIAIIMLFAGKGIKNKKGTIRAISAYFGVDYDDLKTMEIEQLLGKYAEYSKYRTQINEYKYMGVKTLYRMWMGRAEDEEVPEKRIKHLNEIKRFLDSQNHDIQAMCRGLYDDIRETADFIKQNYLSTK